MARFEIGDEVLYNGQVCEVIDRQHFGSYDYGELGSYMIKLPDGTQKKCSSRMLYAVPEGYKEAQRKAEEERRKRWEEYQANTPEARTAARLARLKAKGLLKD